jgi:hypothetical protein
MFTFHVFQETQAMVVKWLPHRLSRLRNQVIDHRVCLLDRVVRAEVDLSANARVLVTTKHRITYLMEECNWSGRVALLSRSRRTSRKDGQCGLSKRLFETTRICRRTDVSTSSDSLLNVISFWLASLCFVIATDSTISLAGGVSTTGGITALSR